MFETFVTVIGTVVSEPQRRSTSSGADVVSFRVASNSRRMDRESKEWVDGPSLYLTVSCWRRLVEGVSGAVAKGRPVIVHGAIRTNSYIAADGERRWELEMKATSVGLDLARCRVDYREVSAPAVPGDEDTQPVEIVTDGATTSAERGTAA